LKVVVDVVDVVENILFAFVNDIVVNNIIITVITQLL